MSDSRTWAQRLPWPPLIYVGALALAILLGVTVPLPWLPRPMSDLIFAVGFLVILAGIALFATAIRALTRARTPINPQAQPEHLVTGGPFAISRNPIYLGNTLVMIGLGLVFGLVWFLVLAPLAAFATQKAAVEPEEARLDARFGKRFRDYRKRVRRWI